MLEDIKENYRRRYLELKNIAKRKREEDYPRARAVFFTIVRNLDPNLSLAKIGKFMGRSKSRNGTTCL